MVVMARLSRQERPDLVFVSPQALETEPGCLRRSGPDPPGIWAKAVSAQGREEAHGLEVPSGPGWPGVDALPEPGAWGKHCCGGAGPGAQRGARGAGEERNSNG